MRLNKSAQYGLLFVLYLQRAGRARVEDAAANLGLSRNFLKQIACKLRVGNVVQSVRGPGGGYQLVEDVKFVDVLEALKIEPFLGTSETERLQTGGPEQRALANFVGALSFHVEDLLKTTANEVNEALVQQETEQLDSISDSATAN